MQQFQPGSEASCSWDRGAFCDTGLEGGVETEVREEGSLPRGGVLEIIEGELGQG